MNNNLLRIKIQQRLNKLASQDHDNIECWQISEAFNKAQTEWVRRQLNGTNNRREGDEASTTRIDDLQSLLASEDLCIHKRDGFYETDPIPSDYLRFKRVSVTGSKDSCKNRKLRVYLAEESDVDILLSDNLKKPSFDWGETFCTFMADKIRVYTNDEFSVEKPELIYYRYPRPVKFAECADPATGVLQTDQECELKEDAIEMLIDEAATILAADIESQLQMQRNAQNAERNN